MLAMIEYTFRGGSGGREAYQRFSKWAPSSGLEIKGLWASASNAGGFILIEADSAGAMLEFSAKFKDLNEDIVFTPVVEIGEALPIIQKAYEWVDSVS